MGKKQKQAKPQSVPLSKEEKKERKRQRREAFRLRIFSRDGGKCFWCDQELFLIVKGMDVTNIPKWVRATLDHVQPRSRGGSNGSCNLVTCCPHCNGKRENYLFNPHTGELISPFAINVFLYHKEVEGCGV